MSWVQVTDKQLSNALAALAGAKTATLLVGVRAVPGSDLATIAAANEFGTSRIPARSFLRSTVDDGRVKYAVYLDKIAGDLVDGINPVRALSVLGMALVGDVQQRIRNRIPPPNAPYTIARKGSDVPLIDTGRLRQSIDFVVETR